MANLKLSDEEQASFIHIAESLFSHIYNKFLGVELSTKEKIQSIGENFFKIKGNGIYNCIYRFPKEKEYIRPNISRKSFDFFIKQISKFFKELPEEQSKKHRHVNLEFNALNEHIENRFIKGQFELDEKNSNDWNRSVFVSVATTVTSYLAHKYSIAPNHHKEPEIECRIYYRIYPKNVNDFHMHMRFLVMATIARHGYQLIINWKIFDILSNYTFDCAGTNLDGGKHVIHTVISSHLKIQITINADDLLSDSPIASCYMIFEEDIIQYNALTTIYNKYDIILFRTKEFIPNKGINLDTIKAESHPLSEKNYFDEFKHDLQIEIISYLLNSFEIDFLWQTIHHICYLITLTQANPFDCFNNFCTLLKTKSPIITSHFENSKKMQEELFPVENGYIEYMKYTTSFITQKLNPDPNLVLEHTYEH